MEGDENGRGTTSNPSAGMFGHGSILSGKITGLHARQYGPMWHLLAMNTFNYLV